MMILGRWILCAPRCVHAYLGVCFLPGSCVVRDASGLLNDTLSPSSSSENCAVLTCHYGWDFTECINNNTCAYGISNYYQVSAHPHTKTREMCLYITLSASLGCMDTHCFLLRLQTGGFWVMQSQTSIFTSCCHLGLPPCSNLLFAHRLILFSLLALITQSAQ